MTDMERDLLNQQETTNKPGGLDSSALQRARERVRRMSAATLQGIEASPSDEPLSEQQRFGHKSGQRQDNL